MEAAGNSARRRLLGLEDRIPWNAVKKSWAATQQKWKNIVTSALDFNALAPVSYTHLTLPTIYSV